MESDFRISSEQMQADVPVTVFHLRGWLDAHSEEELLAAARTAYDEGVHYLLIDMKELETLTSAGMRALQKVYQIFTPKEEHFKVAHVKLCNAPPQIYNILGITGFLHNIPMYESLSAALQSFGKQ
ncbi:MAG TPA: STAS domain-containing protein [Anaerolineales bacterium]|nr:STAS domain-containing protein [Anaerolineales bacterium]